MPMAPGLRPGLSLAALVLVAPAMAQPNLLQEASQRFHPVVSSGGMVAAQEARAAAVGAQILRQGGNAVDAAVATSFALAVTLPQAGNLGGGGFLVLWLPQGSAAANASATAAADPLPQARAIGRGVAVAVNFRETAPLAARPNLFLRPDGSVDRERATRSLLSTAVPGTVAGLTLVQRRYGRLPLRVVVQPAVTLAAEGFPVGVELSESLQAAAPLLKADPSSARQFFKADGTAYRPGEILRQPLLAGSLRRIASAGEAGFYRGPVAAALTALMRKRGGLITQADLDRYRAQWLSPLQGQFRGYRVVTMPPPSGGGATLLQLLNVLAPLDLGSTGLNSAPRLHPMVEAMNLAYRDRNRLLGDPDQVAMPLDRLLSARYADQQRQRLRADRHRPAAELEAEASPLGGGTNTTHISVVDRDGGLVATTTTLNTAYGNGISVPGAGFLLNNEMDDFTAKPGAANAYGLRQGEQNAIAPGKRPLSSITPTLVSTPAREPPPATGSPGVCRPIPTVVSGWLNLLVHGLPPAAPRVRPTNPTARKRWISSNGPTDGVQRQQRRSSRPSRIGGAYHQPRGVPGIAPRKPGPEAGVRAPWLGLEGGSACHPSIHAPGRYHPF